MDWKRFTADQLTDAGRAAFGPRWQSSLADFLGVNSSRIRGVLAGSRRAPPGWTDEILDLLEQRAGECLDAKAALEEQQQKKMRLFGHHDLEE